ncbi:unnamed protein product [Effrenium voratum]|nr:unnamed protein product [Effrenium voratum]
MRKGSNSDLVAALQKDIEEASKDKEEASKAVDFARKTLEFEREQARQSEVLTPDKACQQIELGVAEGKISSPKPSETPEIVKDSRTNEIKIMQNYIRDSIEGKNRNIADSKFPILGTSGMKGIGKTTMLKYGLSKVLPDLKMSAKGAYLTFNGGSAESANVFVESQTQHNSPLRSVGHVLMANVKVEAQQYSLLDFEQCLNLFRKALDMSEGESLVLFIDEIGELKKQADDVLKALISTADARGGKLVFVFAHISQQFLDHAATGSGRKVLSLPLEALPIDTWKQKKDWKDAAQKHAGIHQLLLQCCGHPRSLYDGLDEAKNQNPTLLSTPTEDALIKARGHIITECKFNSESRERLNKDIPRWFSLLEDSDLMVRLARDGLLLKLPHADAQFFPPLILQDWAGKSCRTPLGFHLQQAYAADALLGSDTEKKMEPLMYHYEALLRKASEGKTFTEFYKSEHVSPKLVGLEVKAKVPAQERLVEFVKDFSEQARVLELLQTGFIVVSEFQNEHALEYLSPFQDASADSVLIVACVQCKFVQSTVKWSDIQTKMADATKWLKQKKIKCVPVIRKLMRGASISMTRTCLSSRRGLECYDFTHRSWASTWNRNTSG